MIKLPAVNMPLELVFLLKKELNNPKDMADVVDRVLKRNHAMEVNVLNALSEFDSQKRIHNIVSSLGQKNFRNRLTSIYLYRFMNGGYPVKSNPELVSDVAKFEDLFFNYQVHNSSRIFLFGLYLIMAEIHSERMGEDTSGLGIIGFPRELLNCLKKSTGRVFELDWILFFLWHCYQYWGIEHLDRMLIESNYSYGPIYEKFSLNQKEHFLQNALAYGASIKETEIYFWEKIG